MAEIQVPPVAFHLLYNHYRNGTPPGGFLFAVLQDKAYLSAASADPINRARLADIILFNHWASDYGYARQVGDNAAFDLKWEAWRIRFSPDAHEIALDHGDDDE